MVFGLMEAEWKLLQNICIGVEQDQGSRVNEEYGKGNFGGAVTVWSLIYSYRCRSLSKLFAVGRGFCLFSIYFPLGDVYLRVCVMDKSQIERKEVICTRR